MSFFKRRSYTIYNIEIQGGIRIFHDGFHSLNDCRSLTMQLRKLKSVGGRQETVSCQNQGTQTGTCLKWFVTLLVTALGAFQQSDVQLL